MSSSLPRAARGPLLLLLILMAMCAIALAATPAARAGSIPARTCAGASTSVPTGFATAGQWVVLENNVGQRPKYATTTNLGGSPVCATRSTGSGLAGDPQWIFCTQAALYGCGQDALGPTSLGADLDARARAEIAWAIASADLSSPAGRAVAQTRVWCVSERVQRHRSDADILTIARDHFAEQGVALPAGTACPTWRSVDAGLRTRPQLTVRAPAASVDAGGVARFEITTNLPEVRVASTVPLEPCPDAPAGTWLADGTLGLSDTAEDRARTIPLCGLAPAAGGAARVDVSAPGPQATDLVAVRSLRAPTDCQLMVTARGTRVAASASVMATAPAPAPAALSRPAPPTVVTAQATPAPRLAIAKRRVRRAHEPRRVASGAAVRWAITVRNAGTAAARGVRVCDTLPRGLAALRTAPRATPTRGRVCWRIARLGSGARATLRITTRVSVDQAGGPRCRALANRATITGGPSASSTVTVCRRRHAPSGGTTG